MTLPVILALWFALFAHRLGKRWAVWGAIGAVLSILVLNVVIFVGALLFGPFSPEGYLAFKVISACISIVTTATIGVFVIRNPRSILFPLLFAYRNPLSILVHSVLVACALTAVIPFIWVLCAAFKSQEDIFAFVFLPDDLGRLTLNNIRTLFTRIPFARWLFNSCFLASMQTVIVVTLSSLGGFALAKYRFRGRRVLMLVMLGTMLLPSQVLLPSMYELVYHLGWMNSYFAILAPGSVSVFGMFLFRQAMMGVPDELLQAGRVDGCSELRLWWEIALPVVRPMVGAYTLLAFLSSWNSFLWPQIILQDEAKYTLPIGLTNMMGLPGFDTEYGALMAGALLSILPVVILFFVLQRDFIAGLTSGAVKG